MPRHRLTRALEGEIILRHSRGETVRAIAEAVGLSASTVHKAIHQPALAATNRALASLDAQTRQTIRQEQKDRLLGRLAEVTDRACDLVGAELAQGRPQGFDRAMSGLERLDKVSGSVMGEAQMAASGPPVVVDLKLLIQQVLGAEHLEPDRPRSSAPSPR